MLIFVFSSGPQSSRPGRGAGSRRERRPDPAHPPHSAKKHLVDDSFFFSLAYGFLIKRFGQV